MLNTRLIIFLLVVLALVGYPIYIYIDSVVSGGIKDRGGYKWVDLKAMSLFPLDQIATITVSRVTLHVLHPSDLCGCGARGGCAIRATAFVPEEENKLFDRRWKNSDRRSSGLPPDPQELNRLDVIKSRQIFAKVR